MGLPAPLRRLGRARYLFQDGAAPVTRAGPGLQSGSFRPEVALVCHNHGRGCRQQETGGGPESD